MPNLYQLGSDYRMLVERLADTADDDGVVDASLLPAIGEARELIEQKGVSIGCVVKTLAARKSEIDTEVERLKLMSDVIDSRIKYLKNAVSNVCTQCGIERIDGMHATISFRASEQTVIDDETVLPDEYVIVKTTKTPDKNKIKNAIKAGQAVAGAHIESKRNIQIK